MSNFIGNKAAGRRAADPLDTVLNPAPHQQASNQVRFTTLAPEAMSATPRSNQTRVQANDKNTGREDASVTLTYASKRKLNLPLPANF